MYGFGGEKWKHNRHMWPVPSNATAVVTVSSPSQFICKDGRKIRVGDCALFKPPQESPPFIGIIRKLTFDKEENPSFEVNWFYRPADLNLTKGVVVEAAPNEVFYSFHKDEIHAASLLHPCKVAFLRKGVELPSGISAFVCRRVYDIENNCLRWLTDKDYNNEQQEEVDHLLEKTKLEMHGAVQSGGRSPKPLNGPTSTQSLKSGSDNIQNNSSFSVQGKGKKRERGDQGSDSSKKERLFKAEDGDSGQFRPESMLRSEIARITDKGGLVDFEGVERLVQLMQPDSPDKKVDLSGRMMLVDVISLTERHECLGWFVQLRGLPVLDEWLQEVHKGKIGDGNVDKSEDFLLALLRALDKLPVNLHALQTCNVGKSVNNLRSHKNSEIQRKARSLVDTWKKRVEAEMNMSDTKSGPTRTVSWPSKPAPSDPSHSGNRKSGVTSENVAKSSGIQPTSKNSQSKLNSGEVLSKFSSSPGPLKSLTVTSGSNLKDQNVKLIPGAATSDLPLTPIKEERSSSSSQSQNNSRSCSSEHASKVHGGSSRTRKSSNGVHGTGVAVIQKDHSSAKNSRRNSPSDKVSPTRMSHEKPCDHPLADQGHNPRLILRLPTTGRSPSRGASGGTSEEPAITCGKTSPPADKNENQDRKVKAKTDCLQTHLSNVTNDSSNANEITVCDESKGSPLVDERCRADEDGDKVAEMSKTTSSSTGFVSRSGQTYDASLSPMNALVESCVKFSEASASVSPGDDGMNLLASVAAGEMSRSENVSPLPSPERKSPAADESCSGNDSKFRHSYEAAARTLGQSDGGATGEHPLITVDQLQLNNDSRHPVTTMTHDFSDGEAISSTCVEKTGDGRTQINFSTTDPIQNTDGSSLRPDTKEDNSETMFPGRKETRAEAGEAENFQEPTELGTQWAKCSSSPGAKLKSRTSSFDDDQKIDNMDGAIAEHDKMLVSTASAMIENEHGKKSPELSSGVDCKSQIRVEKVTGTVMPIQKGSLVTDNSESRDLKMEDVISPASGNALTVSRDENANNVTPVAVEPDEKRKDLDSAVADGVNEHGEESSDRKDVIGSGSSVHPDLPIVPEIEDEVPKKCDPSLERKKSVAAMELNAANAAPSPIASGSDAAVKLDFDLNEGYPVEDVGQGDIIRPEEPISSSAVHVPSPLPFPTIPSLSGAFHASITVASAAKGPVVPPENPLRSKGELGWKGSAATSAFRPAEPRKNAEAPSNTGDIPAVDATSVKQGRTPLDFDLNVADDINVEDVAYRGSLESGAHDRSTVGFDLDLNRLDDTPEAGPFSMGIPSFPSKQPSLSSGVSNGGSVSRDFDLNNGPGLDEVSTEVPARSLQMKSTVPFSNSVQCTKTINAEFGNYSSWFPPGNSYSAITVPPLLPGRGEQSYVGGSGVQRIIGSTGSTPFSPEMYRGPVLSSSPAVAYPPTTPFPYPGFPFETNFPLSSSAFSGSTPFMDSSTVGGLCFPTMPSQPVGPGGVMSSTYPRPYVVSLPGGTSNIIPDSRKWGSQSLDLNSGPGGTDTERRDDRLPSGMRQMPVPSPQALMEDHLKKFQMAGALKRKEPDGSWDGTDRFTYKHPSWQ